MLSFGSIYVQEFLLETIQSIHNISKAFQTIQIPGRVFVFIGKF